MPQFDQFLLITLVITAFAVFGFFHNFFLNKFIYPIKQVIELRKKLKALKNLKKSQSQKFEDPINFFQDHLKRVSEKNKTNQ